MLFEEVVNKNYSNLNTNEREVIQSLISNKKSYSKFTIDELSKKLLVSTSFIVRLAKKLEYSGFSEMKYQLKSESNNLSELPSSKDIEDIAAGDIKNTKTLMHSETFDEVVQLMLHSNNIYTFGTGYAQQIMLDDFKRGMIYCNRFVISIPTTKELRINAETLKPDDIIFVVSYSGNVPTIAKELNQLTMKGVNVISITLFKNNQLSNLATKNLYIQSTPILGTNTEEGYYSYVPLSLLLDTLVRNYLFQVRKEEL